ncbi:hypothetical protein HB375_01070 [Microvirga sp. c23x22]|uniref:Phospholipid-binding protein n=2 Tax=Microvirga terricola TaxID=2719797 RepID=A0ABX0V5U5_9HYPH|nr:hypothetical protein [Microvirga terricola]
MSISVDWTGTTECFDRESPLIKLKDVPKRAVKLRLAMVDLDAPQYPHGGGEVAYKEQAQLAKGAFRYTGPCPPAIHQYQWTIEALDASGEPVDSAKVVVPFPPK